MKKILISKDKFGYVNGIEDVTSKTEEESLMLAAKFQNYWWESGGLENVPGDWTISDYSSFEDAEKECSMSDCRTAFNIANVMNLSAKYQCDKGNYER